MGQDELKSWQLAHKKWLCHQIVLVNQWQPRREHRPWAGAIRQAPRHGGARQTPEGLVPPPVADAR